MSGQVVNLVLSVIAVHVFVSLGNSCDWRYFKHYEQKACRPVLGADDCPIKFLCDPLSEEDRKTCVHNGRIYKDREAIQDLGPCDSCRCEVNRYGSASIECAEVDCPDWDTKNKSCYMGYKPDTCCPIEMCSGGKTEDQKTCSHNGKNYKIGEIIDTSDPCKSCICTEKWTGENGFGCSAVNCLLGIYADKIRSGCLPIYREKGCCPTEVNCGELFGATPTEDVGENKDDYCHYQRRYYERGSTAYFSSDKHQCVTCRCTTPPDFNCMRKACPPKPSPDCKAVYGTCCPAYKCP